MKGAVRAIFKPFVWLLLLLPVAAWAQIDPVKRDLVQFGYNQPVEGCAPLGAYAFYYHNQPDFLRTNLTLRLAVAPTYVDSEFGFANALGPNTDLGLGVAGGGFADSYNEIRSGQWIKDESFDGHCAELSSSVYHRFNPDQMIPLNLVVRGAAHYSAYEKNDTAADFKLPDDGGDFSVRTGLRYGGVEPTLFPELAMELSVWYEGRFRTASGGYGFNDDRRVEPDTHLFWSSAALSYTLPESKQNFFVRLTAGTSVDADRLSAYRLGGYLPLVAEYPLSIPGYFFQEFSARDFALINASYLVPIAPNERWNLVFNGATANIDYLSDTEPTGNWVSGVGAGILYRSPSDQFKVIAAYGYGFDARRADGLGASSICLLLQIDLGRIRSPSFTPAQPGHWRGWDWLVGR